MVMRILSYLLKIKYRCAYEAAQYNVHPSEVICHTTKEQLMADQSQKEKMIVWSLPLLNETIIYYESI